MSDAGLFDLVSQYYLKATSREQNQYTRGQMYWCPCLYFDQELRILHPRGFDPYDRLPPIWETKRIDPRAFNDQPHKPLLKPKLGADEEFVVLTAKKRPVVLLSSQSEPWRYRSGKAREECFLVAPLYSFEDSDPIAWKLKIRALAYRELFYLPADDNLAVEEGFIRFDRAHVVPKRWLGRMHVCLHPDALLILTTWFQFYLTGTVEDFYLEYRANLLQRVQQILGEETK